MATSGATIDHKDDDAAGGEETDEFSDEFMCCVCLDLVYKPVVLACGHISCFWCVFEAMGYSCQDSRCPVCRQSYNHFPSICRQLHFVLLKLYPVAYKRRETQVVEEEKKCGTFSPQFDDYLCKSYSDKGFRVGGSSLQSTSDSQDKFQLQSVKEGEHSLVKDSSEVVPSDKDLTAPNLLSLNDGNTEIAVQEGKKVRGEHIDGTCKRVLFSDLLCALCKQLLYRPVVLNCGHVFCEGCIINPCDKQCRCPECQSMHPNGFPKVCLVIEHFLEEHVSEEYAARRLAIGSPSTGSIQAEQEGATSTSLPSNDDLLRQGLKVHFGVGCDCCGMCPISGERYHCKDCVEEIGFDLCEGCYKTSSKLPGRFNQQHTPDHKFEVLGPPYFLPADFFDEYGPYSPEELMHVFPISDHPSRGPQSDSEADLPAPNSSNENDEAHDP